MGLERSINVADLDLLCWRAVLMISLPGWCGVVGLDKCSMVWIAGGGLLLGGWLEVGCCKM